MNEITRFDLDMDGSMEPSEHGRWVRYKDAQRQCTWPICQSEEYQQALAEQIKQELVTGAAQRPWIGLTDEDKLMCWARATHDADVEHKTEHQCLMDYGTEIEAKLRSKNNG
jgi:hypothetical protein